jgi:hypothetical protein
MWSDQEPIAKGLESSDRIDRESQIENERAANRHIPTRSIGGRYFRERSVSIPWRSITHGSTDRKKVLQTGALMTVLSMRSVLYSAYQVRSPPYRDLLTIQQALSKPP